jgi:hypothetical protein
VLERVLDRARIGGAVPVDAAERGPRLRDDPVRGVEVAKRLLGEERVQLDLVDGRHDIVRLSRLSRCCGLKFETPIARARPSASICSAALYGPTVPSKSPGTG